MVTVFTRDNILSLRLNAQSDFSRMTLYLNTKDIYVKCMKKNSTGYSQKILNG